MPGGVGFIPDCCLGGGGGGLILIVDKGVNLLFFSTFVENLAILRVIIKPKCRRLSFPLKKRRYTPLSSADSTEKCPYILIIVIKYTCT